MRCRGSAEPERRLVSRRRGWWRLAHQACELCRSPPSGHFRIIHRWSRSPAIRQTTRAVIHAIRGWSDLSFSGSRKWVDATPGAASAGNLGCCAISHLEGRCAPAARLRCSAYGRSSGETGTGAAGPSARALSRFSTFRASRINSFVAGEIAALRRVTNA